MAIFQPHSGNIINGASVVLDAGNPQTLVHSFSHQLASGDSLAIFQNLDGRYLAGDWRQILPQASGDSATATNATAEVNYVELPGKRHGINGIDWSFNGTPSGQAYVQIESPSGTLLWGPHYITAAGPGFHEFPGGLVGLKERSLKVHLNTGGAGVTGTVSVKGRFFS